MSRGCSGQDEQRQGQSKLSPAVVLVFGPTRLHLGPLDLSISSFPRLIVILLVTLTSRHLLVPKPTIVARAIDAFSRLRCSTTTRAGSARVPTLNRAVRREMTTRRHWR